jgi:hypothetical protein
MFLAIPLWTLGMEGTWSCHMESHGQDIRPAEHAMAATKLITLVCIRID